jgi:predicted amino acid racemase
MSAPRLEINISKIHSNARELVRIMSKLGISVTGVTKAFLGLPEIVGALLRAGVGSLGDSRIETIESMRQTHAKESMMLIRSPMMSQAERVVMSSDISFNTELKIISRLSFAAQKADCIHGIVLMVELGDLREGIMPNDMESVVRKTLEFPNIALRGIGTNLACRCGIAPDSVSMATLSELANSIEATFGITLDIVSGGNSANIEWALSGADLGRVNNLRLGESILLGRETLYRTPIKGLFLDAFTLVAEVIELKTKPSQPIGKIAQSALLGVLPRPPDRGSITQSILGIGHQDTDLSGLTLPLGLKFLGASSDHLILEDTDQQLSIGSEVIFQLNYGALLRAMTSPFVTKRCF